MRNFVGAMCVLVAQYDFLWRRPGFLWRDVLYYGAIAPLCDALRTMPKQDVNVALGEPNEANLGHSRKGRPRRAVSSKDV
jgi:hypothetical protein